MEKFIVYIIYCYTISLSLRKNSGMISGRIVVLDECYSRLCITYAAHVNTTYNIILYHNNYDDAKDAVRDMEFLVNQLKDGI